ncbi:MAG: type II secretion system protein GspJ [Pseudomonadota bacterium]
MKLGAKPSDAGFTLIEVLLSLAIMSSIVALVWGSFYQTVGTKERVEAIGDHYHQIRLAMNRMAREISMAYLSKNDIVGAIIPRTLFLSQRNSDVDEITFSNLAHERLRENAKECDQSVIRYYSAPDPGDRSIKNLMRRESRRVGGEHPGEEGPAYVMLENIEELHFEFFDEQANEWRENWNTNVADGQVDRLPTKLRIFLTVRDSQEKPITLLTATRTFLRDPLWFSPQ